MDWRPNGYKISTQGLVKAIFDNNSDEAKVLLKAVAGEIELFADSKSWNAILWLIMNTLKVEGKPVYSGQKLGALKTCLPIVWR
ncbi:MAG TPA: hypothetical protein EYQ73_00320 [Candidatus Poseidoniales archaeon]|jgi:hypothetical protein|nr:hypothetical protein [Candidatus Poseidoniales archaeon]HIL66063.1 hypothetical protein [Candidatus Poseidoniales archaeon]